MADFLRAIYRLFLLFVLKFAEIPCLRDVGKSVEAEKPQPEAPIFNEDDDIDLCLYYLRTLHHVLDSSGENSRAVLVSKHLSFNSVGQVQISSMYFTLERIDGWCLIANL